MEAFVRKVSNEIDPVHDIIFSSGPMDVLDHASSKFAFGSKMGIDATTKFPEEMNVESTENRLPGSELFDNIAQDMPAIKSVQTSLLDKGISVLVLGIEKEQNFRPAILTETLENVCHTAVKFILLSSCITCRESDAVVWYVTETSIPEETAKSLRQPSRKFRTWWWTAHVKRLNLMVFNATAQSGLPPL